MGEMKLSDNETTKVLEECRIRVSPESEKLMATEMQSRDSRLHIEVEDLCYSISRANGKGKFPFTFSFAKTHTPRACWHITFCTLRRRQFLSISFISLLSLFVADRPCRVASSLD
jgi:hypothetical protein